MICSSPCFRGCAYTLRCGLLPRKVSPILPVSVLVAALSRLYSWAQACAAIWPYLLGYNTSGGPSLPSGAAPNRAVARLAGIKLPDACLVAVVDTSRHSLLVAPGADIAHLLDRPRRRVGWQPGAWDIPRKH